MSKDIKLNVNDLPALLGRLLKRFNAYKVFIFFLAVAGLYSYILWRINVYSNTPPSQSEVSAQTTTQPRIDPDTVKKIQNLQDNSVGVQSIFEQARQNPFQE